MRVVVTNPLTDSHERPSSPTVNEGSSDQPSGHSLIDSHVGPSSLLQDGPSQWLDNHSKCVPVFLWNACSLANKLSSFHSFIYSSDYKIYAITETWLNESFSSREIFPPVYNVYRYDRKKRRGGGVLLAIHTSLPSSLISTPLDLELVCVKLCFPSYSYIVCTAYLPPNAGMEYLSQLSLFCASLQTS